MRFWRRMLIGLPVLLLVLPAELRGETLRHGQGLLWRIKSAGIADSYLFGTIHTTDPDIVALPKPVADVFAGCASVALEAVLDDATMRQWGEAMLLDGGQSLDKILGSDLFIAVADATRDYGLPPDHLKLLTPWAVMLMLAYPSEEVARQAAGEKMLDARLQAEAMARGKPIHGLETVQELIAVFDIPLAEQRQLLEMTVAQYPEIGAIFEQMKRAYLARDVASLFALMLAPSPRADPEVLPSFTDRILTQRNYRMAERLGPLLAEGNLCIAVGALHLPGDEGVLHLLERRGFRVERLY